MFSFLKNLFGSPVDFKQLMADGALIIDVRTPQEFQSGHIKGSINIPLDKLKKEIPDLKKKNKTILTVCRSGNRSGMGKSMLKASGIDTYNGGPWNSLEKKLK